VRWAIAAGVRAKGVVGLAERQSKRRMAKSESLKGPEYALAERYSSKGFSP
jgi:hypothetical protein